MRIYHHGSADLIDDTVRALGHVDVLIVGLAYRKRTPDFLGRMLTMLQPKLAIPTHHDNFFMPYGLGVCVMHNTHFRDFVATVRNTTPQARIVTLGFFDEYRFNAASGP
jgi:L-ascorbate metabolism protein UlaG (beta-lactamase superfamily)